MEPILTNEAKQNHHAALHGEPALYGREVENVAVHLSRAFETAVVDFETARKNLTPVLSPATFDPELGRRIAIANAESEKRRLARLKVVYVAQNCSIRVQYKSANGLPPAQCKAIFYKPECTPGVPCTTGGGHGSIEWCGECEKVV